MPNFNDEDRDSSTDDDWDKSSSDEEEKKPVQAGEFFFGRKNLVVGFMPNICRDL